MHPFLQIVTAFIDRMLEHGLDRYGPQHSPMFASILDLETLKVPEVRPPAIPGQREGDRAYRGSNLMHDIPLLGTLYDLASNLDCKDYAEAADAYLRFFAEHCTTQASGLFPWGEHAFWHLFHEAPGNSHSDGTGKPMKLIHDHLRQAPVWFWEKMWTFNPDAVLQFADGLYQHVTDTETFEYIRHAPIESRDHHPKGNRSCDFPRHGGFYMLDWAFAYQKALRPRHLELCRRMDAYHLGHLDRWKGLPIESRTPPDDPVGFHEKNAPVQQLSLAVSLLETADLIDDLEPAIASDWRSHAEEYIEGFFLAPHDLEKGIYVLLSDRRDNSAFKTAVIWGSIYGAGSAAYFAVLCSCLYRRLGQQRFLDWAASVFRQVMAHPVPGELQIPAMDMGLTIELAADLYDLTGEQEFLKGAARLSERAVELYSVSGFLRGATNIDYYDSQMGVAYLVHALARTAACLEDSPSLQPDYTAR